MIDTFKAGNFITVIVAIQMEDDKLLDEKLEQISQLQEVHCALCRYRALRYLR